MHRFTAWGKGFVRQPANVLILIQLLAILVVGGVTVEKFHVFAPVDEVAHVAYVQEVAEHGRLPFLGRDNVSPQVLQVYFHTYPRPVPANVTVPSLLAKSYEGFQPPLYYGLAVPAYLVPHEFTTKVKSLRGFDFLLLLIGVALLAVLARRVFRERWKVPYALALTVVLWPGVIVRSVTVSSAPLEIPMVLLYLLAVWTATERRSLRWLAAGGALLGLCMLTKLTLITLAPLLLLPLVVILRERRDGRTLAGVAGSLLLPLLLLAPWLISNVDRYGTLTSNAIGKQLQESTVNPNHLHYGMDFVFSHLWRFFRAALPQEWWGEYHVFPFGILLRALPIVLLGLAVVAIARRPGLLRSREAVILGAPFVLGFLSLVGIILFADWPSYLPRYLYSTGLPFTLFVAWAWIRAGQPKDGGDTTAVERALVRSDRTLLILASVCTVVLLVAWVYMFAAFYSDGLSDLLGGVRPTLSLDH